MLCGKVPCKGRPKARRKRTPGAARSFSHQLARARDGVPQQVWFPCWSAKRRDSLWGTPHALRKQFGHGNGAAMQSMENDKAVSHPSHSRLEDADKARVSHIPTTTATRFDKKDKQLRMLHQSISLLSPTENARKSHSENATYRDQLTLDTVTERPCSSETLWHMLQRAKVRIDHKERQNAEHTRVRVGSPIHIVSR